MNSAPRIVSVDFESYYSSDYSLTKLTEVEYILSPLFEIICASIKEDDGPSECYWGDAAVAAKLGTYDWSKTAMCSHNMRFDGAIMAWHYGIIPKLYIDTLSMARALVAHTSKKLSLKVLSTYFKFPPKGEEIVMARGKTKAMFSPDEQQAYMRYCNRDNDNCYDMFKKMQRRLPASELRIIDWVMRMFIEPQVKLNSAGLALHANSVRAEQQRLMATISSKYDPTILSSNPRFAALLESLGVEVPYKQSPTDPSKWIPALATKDAGFIALRADDSLDLEVQTLLAARVGAKSTIELTRTEKLLKLSLQEWPIPGTPKITPELRAAARSHGLLPNRGMGWFAVPLKYSGAHTHRLSGDGGYNVQNFKRSSPIRYCIEAPPGYRIVHRDASQIEARMVAWLSGCTALCDAFRRGEDVYSLFASEVYQRKITKADKIERFVGKTSILGLGYGMGAERFQHTLLVGSGGMSLRVEMSQAEGIVKTYRYTYGQIPKLWWRLGDELKRMVGQSEPNMWGSGDITPRMEATIGPSTFTSNSIVLPNGLAVAYPDLQTDTNGEVTYEGPYGRVRLFGGKVLENWSQALCRIILTDIVRRVYTSMQIYPWLTTHDSLDYCVPEDEAEAFDSELEAEFAVIPLWANGLPLASEGGWGTTLSMAEMAANK